MDSQGEDYQFHYTLPSQSQLEENISKLTIQEEREDREGGGGELQFEDDDDDVGGGGFQTIAGTACSYCGIHDPASLVMCNLCKR